MSRIIPYGRRPCSTIRRLTTRTVTPAARFTAVFRRRWFRPSRTAALACALALMPDAGAAAGPGAAAQPPDPQAVARAAAIEFAEGRYSELYARFDTRMRSAITEQMLRQSVGPQVTAPAGAFERVDGATACQDTPAAGS